MIDAFKTIKEKVLLKNLISLLGSQAINFLIPLLTYPYLIKTIGLDHFGRVQFMLSIVLLLGMVTDFGYNYTAPREIAKNRADRMQLSIIISNVLSFKLIVFTILSTLLLLSTFVFQSVQIGLIGGGLMFLLNLTLTPNWFFLGIEKMEYIAIVDILSKLLFTATIFFVIKTPDDFIWVLPLWGMGGVISAVTGFAIIRRKYNLIYRIPSARRLLQELSSGVSPFMTNLATYSVTSSPMLLLGFFHPAHVVGIYAIAEKLIRIPWILGGLFSQAIYPRVCHLYQEQPGSVMAFFKRTLPFFYIGQMMLLTTMWIAAEPIVRFFSSEYINDTVLALRLLSFSVLFVIINVPFQTVLLAQHQDNMVMRIFIKVAGINLLLAIVLIYLFALQGAALASSVTMALLCLSLVRATFYLIKHK